MRKILLLISAVAIALFITACGDNNNDDVNDNNGSEDVTDNQNSGDTNSDNKGNNGSTNDNSENANQDESDSNSTEDMQAKMDELPYAEIELEVDYGKDNEYEIEIEQDEGQPIEAEIEDEVNGVFLKGEEAFNELYPKVKALSIDKDTDKETAIKDALETFDLDENYDKFEIEITFTDGEKLEYEDK